MSAILYYISGHGYGHAIRSSQVIRSLKKTRPDLKVVVRTSVPNWLFPKRVLQSQQSIDVGIVQRDSLTMDLDATLRSCHELFRRAPEIIAKEIEFSRNHDIGLVVGDIPPLCFEIAARLSVPSVAVTNFTWDWIYRAYLQKYPAFLPLIEQMEIFYAKAGLALTLPYPCNMSIFPRQEAIPWIARTSTLTKEAARTSFALPQSAFIVLLSFGGLGLRNLPLEQLESLGEFFFVATGEIEQQGSNWVVLLHAQRHYEDLVRAADVIVTKPGYGIVADAIAQRVPMLYTDRGFFPEYPRLIEALSECAVAEFIPQPDLIEGNLEPYLARLLSKRREWPAVSLSGAERAAEKILACL